MRLALPVPTLRLPAAMRPNPAIFEAVHFSSFNRGFEGFQSFP